MLSQTDHESLRTFAKRTTQTRMDVRLARRVGLRSLTHYPRIEPSCAHQEYAMQPLLSKEEACESEAVMSEEALNSDEYEDDAWLNDRLPIRHESSLQKPIMKEQSTYHYTLTCWL